MANVFVVVVVVDDDLCAGGFVVFVLATAHVVALSATPGPCPLFEGDISTSTNLFSREDALPSSLPSPLCVVVVPSTCMRARGLGLSCRCRRRYVMARHRDKSPFVFSLSFSFPPSFVPRTLNNRETTATGGASRAASSSTICRTWCRRCSSSCRAAGSG